MLFGLKSVRESSVLVSVIVTDHKGKIKFSQVFVCPQLASWLLIHCSALLWRGWYASYSNAFLLPSATVIVERLCFHRCLSLHGGGVHPPWQTPRLGIHPSHGQTIPLGRHPHPADGYCRGRYASYLNAFLFLKCVYFLTRIYARDGKI